MFPVKNKKKINGGSIAVFSLILMLVLAITTMGIITVATIERKTSISTGNSTNAFQIAESGMEKTLQYFKSNFDKTLSDINGSGNCSGGIVKYDPQSMNTIRFIDNAATPAYITDCEALISSVKIIKSIGTTKQETRAIEEDVFLGATKLLLHLNGKNDETDQFEDSSFYYEENQPITTNGEVETAIDSELVKFGGGSAEFDGAGDYLAVPGSDNWDFGDGNFTIDFWVRFKVLPAKATIVSRYHNGSKLMDVYLSNSGGYKWFLKGDGATISTSAVTINPNTWYHIAYVRKDNSLKIFQGGSLLATESFSENLDSFNNDDDLFIGSLNGTSDYLNGYIDELRVSKGVARWWDNFNPYNPSTEYWPD